MSDGSITIGRERVWKLVSSGTGMLTAMVTRKLMRRTYRAIRRDDPDGVFDPTSTRFSWSNAAVWAIAAGFGLVAAKMVGDRLAAIGWKTVTGAEPPGPSAASLG
jgi:hypothetical protein